VSRCAVFGTGSWGTTFALILAEAGQDVRLWGRRPELVDHITAHRRNPDYLPQLELPAAISATTDPAFALADAEYVVLAVPSQSLRKLLTDWAPLLPPDAIVISLMKGVELGTTRRMSEVIAEVTGVPRQRIAVVSGPNLAAEIARRQPTGAVVACVDPEVAARVAHTCATGYFRTYTGQDVIGTELGGAMKNVIALAVGMAAGLDLGDNTKATVITRGLAEATRLGVALGAQPATFAGLAGIGDLIATCMSPLSRNRTFGEELGRGRTVADVVATTRQVAEGVKSCRAIAQLAAAHGVDAPITAGVVAVVHDGLAVTEMAAQLLARARKSET
jgi:glycerol-3-phosphate dehydrogenase (NAD(P)+)